MEANENDVLSGRGRCYNHHPGNKKFRMIIESQMDAYIRGTKKQKMTISKNIVELIHSLEPPGRFLKKCTETGQWKELSRRDAVDKAAQAMAYAVRASGKKTMKGSSLPATLVNNTSQLAQRPPPSLSANADFSGNASFAQQGMRSNMGSGSAANHYGDLGQRNDMLARNPNPSLLQLLHLQQSNTLSNLPATTAGDSPNRLAQMELIARAQQEQQQRQQLLRLLISQQQKSSLGGSYNGLPYPSLLPTQSLSSTQTSSAQGSSLPLSDLLRRDYLLRGLQQQQDLGAGAQLSSLLQRERNNVHTTPQAFFQNGMSNQPTGIASQAQQAQSDAQLQNQLLSSLGNTGVNFSSQQLPPQLLNQLQQFQNQNLSTTQAHEDPPPNHSNQTSASDLPASASAASAASPTRKEKKTNGKHSKSKDSEGDQHASV